MSSSENNERQGADGVSKLDTMFDKIMLTESPDNPHSRSRLDELRGQPRLTEQVTSCKVKFTFYFVLLIGHADLHYKPKV